MSRLPIIFTIVTILIFFGALNNSTAQYERKVVFEEFSEVWCGPCASLAPSISNWLGKHPEYIPIVYTSYFISGGSQVNNNKIDYDARNAFYSVPFYPYARINAELAPNASYPGYPTNLSAVDAIIDTMAKSTPVKTDVVFTNNGATGHISITLNSDEALDDKTLFVMLVEDHHEYEKQPNGMTNYHHIFRDMVNGPNGETFSVDAGGTLTFEYDYQLQGDINYDLSAIAIVQDASTKYIYQSESVFQPSPSSVEDDSDLNSKIIVGPNPFIDNLYISLNSDEEEITEIVLFDMMGECVSTPSVNANSQSLTIEGKDKSGNQLPNGVYLLKVITNKSVYTKKIMLYK